MKKLYFENRSISKLSFGTVQLGLDYGIANTEGKPAQEKADAIISYLLSEGIDCFDTAVAYGESESVLGASFQNLRPANDLKVISKVKSELFDENLTFTIKESLKRLHLPKLFGLLLHDSSPLYNWNSKDSDIVKSVLQSGLTDYFGISIYNDEEFRLAIENPFIRIIQIPFNPLDQRAVTHKWFEMAQERGKLLFIRSIFLQGLLFMEKKRLKGNLSGCQPYLEKFHAIRRKTGLSVTEFSLSYVESVAQNAVILFGAENVSQAKENVETFNRLSPLPYEIIEEIHRTFDKIPEIYINPALWRIS
jgi:aryl-alcohol dehydrogenase-like predicted oxidoreductase